MGVEGKAGLCIFMIICTYYDCRYKGIPVRILRMGLTISALYAACAVLQEHTLAARLILNLLPGGVMLSSSRLMKNKIGPADGMMVLSAGLVLLPGGLEVVLTVAFLLIFIWALLLLIWKKGNRYTQIPFAPFLLAAQFFLWTGN